MHGLLVLYTLIAAMYVYVLMYRPSMSYYGGFSRLSKLLSSRAEVRASVRPQVVGWGRAMGGTILGAARSGPTKVGGRGRAMGGAFIGGTILGAAAIGGARYRARGGRAAAPVAAPEPAPIVTQPVAAPPPPPDEAPMMTPETVPPPTPAPEVAPAMTPSAESPAESPPSEEPVPAVDDSEYMAEY